MKSTVRRRGLAKKLLETILESAKAAGFKVAELHSQVSLCSLLSGELIHHAPHNHLLQSVSISLTSLSLSLCCRSHRLQLQVYVRKLYASVGFVQDGSEFDEEGVPHVVMKRRL